MRIQNPDSRRIFPFLVVVTILVVTLLRLLESPQGISDDNTLSGTNTSASVSAPALRNILPPLEFAIGVIGNVELI